MVVIRHKHVRPLLAAPHPLHKRPLHAQGFLASDRKSALELFDKAEEYFKQCKEKVGV